METRFDETLHAQVTTDDDGRVRQINHFDQLAERESAPQTAREAATSYVRRLAEVLSIDDEQLATAEEPVSYLEPQQQGVRYKLSDEKTLFDATTIGFAQTVLNVPVWNAGIVVTVKHAPYGVVSVSDTSHSNPAALMPGEDAIRRFLTIFEEADIERRLRDSARAFRRAAPSRAATREAAAPSRTAGFVRRAMGLDQGETTRGGGGQEGGVASEPNMVRGRFFVYPYDPERRLPRLEDLAEDSPETPSRVTLPFPLPPVPDSIVPGQYYLVGEVTFMFRDPSLGDLTWRALIEVETEAVLYLRPLAAGVDGLVFRVDPITASGDATATPSRNNATLNPFRTRATLPNLNGPVAGRQALRGRRADLVEVEDPVAAPPTRPTGTNFDFDSRTNDFAAVNAYFHTDNFFTIVESLGFPLSSYFDATRFPVEVDHRGMGPSDGLTVNAHCVGDGVGGIDHVCYALNDTTNMASPIGRACDSRVHWHELGGHGVLYEHVNHPNFGFAHSAGDSLSAILHDPGSRAPDRFRYAPWNPTNQRRFDRDVAARWAWGGANDLGGYESEQILATTMFRFYRSIGGDSTNLPRQRFASRAAMYLILRAIGTLTPQTRPRNVIQFANALMAVDLLNWTTEGVFGGAYNKVLRWAFEKQGLFQPAGAPRPVTRPGAPPEVDVYINDGRAGEYTFQPVHWNTTAIWNRRAADNGTTHQPPRAGVRNFAYVRIRNRGRRTANNVVVRGFHSRITAGMLWPNDVQPMTTAQIAVGTVAANNTQERIVGPFEWTPLSAAGRLDSMLMIVSATGDPSNIDHFTANETIEEWRLVPNDNNAGLRIVQTIAGGGNELETAINGMTLTIANPLNTQATMSVEVTVPPLLAERGWRVAILGLEGDAAVLASGGQTDVTLSVQRGEAFTAEEVGAASIVAEVFANGLLIGGATFSFE